MYTVFIGDDNVNWVNALAAELSKNPNFRVVAQAQNGRQSMEMISSLRPDIIMLDIIMPEYDGIYIVNYIREKMTGYNPIIYILSGIGSDTIINMLNELYIDYYSMKPVTLEFIIQTLETIIEKRSLTLNKSYELQYQPQKSDPVEDTVKVFLQELGLSPHRISTKCSIDALAFFIKNPGYDRILTKVLYPEISKKYKLTDSSVEKNIRNAIAKIQKSDTPLYNLVFAYAKHGKITNGEFLSIASDYLTQRIGTAHENGAQHSERERATRSMTD